MSPANRAPRDIEAKSAFASRARKAARPLAAAFVVLSAVAALALPHARDYFGLPASAQNINSNRQGGRRRPQLPTKVIPPAGQQQPVRPPPPDPARVCPRITFHCPDSFVAGNTLTFKAEPTGGRSGINPKYRWSHSGGRIERGQGSLEMVLNTAGVVGSLTVSVEPTGYGVECPESGCTMRVRRPEEQDEPKPPDPPPADDSPTPGDEDAGGTVGEPTRPSPPPPTVTPTISPTPGMSLTPTPSASPSPFPGASPSPDVTPDASPEATTSPLDAFVSPTPPDEEAGPRLWPWLLLAALLISAGALLLSKGVTARVRGWKERKARLEETKYSSEDEKDTGAVIGGRKKADKEVRCSVFAPEEFSPGDGFVVQAFAHLPEQAYLLAELAKEAERDAQRRGSEPFGRVARGQRLGFHLEVGDPEKDKFEIDEPWQERTWAGEIVSAKFSVNVPESFRARSVNCKLQFSIDTVPIGHVKFSLKLSGAARTDARPRHRADYERYKLAFISYASEDRAEVMRRVQMLDATRVAYFQDVLGLRTGDRWESALYDYIDRCDVFYLFWSSAAKKSEWVEKEVRYALERRGGDFKAPPEIVPIPIEGPPPVEPPPYLSSIHFDPKFLYFINPRD